MAFKPWLIGINGHNTNPHSISPPQPTWTVWHKAVRVKQRTASSYVIFFCWPFIKRNTHVPCLHMRRILRFSRGSGVHIIHEKAGPHHCRASDRRCTVRTAQNWVKNWKQLHFWVSPLMDQNTLKKSGAGHFVGYILSVSSDGEFTSDFLGLINLCAIRMAQDTVNGSVKCNSALVVWGMTGMEDKVGPGGAAVNIGVYDGVVPTLCQISWSYQFYTVRHLITKLLSLHLQKGVEKEQN